MSATSRVDLCGLASLGCWVWLAIESRRPGLVALPVLYVVLAVTWGCSIAAWRFARLVPRKALFARVAIWGMLFRTAGLFGEPVLEDDHYRILWEGRQFALTGDPYRTSPSQSFADPAIGERFQTILDRVNHPDVPAIYGPVAQYGFLLSYLAAPGELWPWKLILIAADAAAAALLSALAPASGVLLFVWCPLSIQETAFSAHPDALGVAFAVAAFFLRRSRPVWAVSAVVAAAGVKATAAVLLPLVLIRSGWRGWFAAIVAVLAVWGPFWLRGSPGGAAGLAAFAMEWEFNSSVFGLISAVTGPRMVRLVCAAAVVACLAEICRRVRKSGFRHDHALAVFGVVFLLSPVVNPWYLLWLLPFGVASVWVTPLVAMAAVSLSYVRGMSLPNWGISLYDHPDFVRIVEYCLVIAAALLESRWRTADPFSGRIIEPVVISDVGAPVESEPSLPSARVHVAVARLLDGTGGSADRPDLADCARDTARGEPAGCRELGGAADRWRSVAADL